MTIAPTPKLVWMANRIAEFFAAMPERGEAMDGVATHLRKFWTPAMRRQLLEYVAAAGDAGLHPLLAESLQRHGQALQPR
jgi:formate dehydrogenase subunit delta